MKDQGLSIFDNEPEDTESADTEATQVIPVVKKSGDEPAAQRTRESQAVPPRAATAPPAQPAPAAAKPTPGPVLPPAAPPAAGATAVAAFPVVRRGGYDKDAVDATSAS